MGELTLLLPTGLAQPYAVSQTDWESIESRVAVALEAQAIAAEIERYIPN
jgi:hypothetical protein